MFLAAVMTFSLGASVYGSEPQDAFPEEEVLTVDAAWDEILEDDAEDVSLDVEDAEAPEALDQPAEATESLDEEEAGKMVYEYRVYVPENYTETQKYPTVYLMPYDGYSADQYFKDGIEAVLDEIMGSDEAIDMVVVMPDYKPGEDYVAKLPELVAEIERKFSVISDPNYRALIGVNVGGYMALEVATIESNNGSEAADLFHCFGSHMGDFTSDANPYLADKGAVNTFVSGMDRMTNRGLNYLSSRYFYIDAPNGSPDSTIAGGTSDIGAGLEKRSNPYYRYGASVYATPNPQLVEYAILDGEENAEFYMSSLHRSLNRFSQRFTENLFTGSLGCTPQAVTSADDVIDATVKITVKGGISSYVDEIPDVILTVKMTDPLTGDELSSVSESLGTLTADEQVEKHIELSSSDMADGLNTTVTASISLLGMEHQIATLDLVTVQDVGEADDEKLIDLMGTWYFKAYKTYRRNDATVVDLDRIAYLTPDVYESWGKVQPCLGWWTSDFDASLNGQDNYGGYAWYIRTFDVPADFPTDDLTMAVGYFDEANETYVNGQLIGSSGMRYDIAPDGVGVYDGSNPWDVNCVYSIDSSVLNYGGTNTIAVRICNSSGGGGWYEGPVGIYSRAAYDKISSGGSRLTVEEYESASTGKTESFRLYLPEDYYEKDNVKRYPSLYLFHGINSTSKTYEIDDIDQVLDQAIEAGLIRDMIVVIPDDPTKKSFWRGTYGDMVIKDLVPYVDENYRTINDERYRFTAGCSMGGAGSVGLGLFNPNLFAGVISFYGALNYTSALSDGANLSKEYLDMYRIYMACGNQDMYDFYDVQEQMSRLLTAKEIEHYHLVDNGTHTSSFYLPHFIPAVQYILDGAYQTSTSAEILSGSIEKKDASADDHTVTALVKLEVSDKISEYLNTVAASDFTENENPPLCIPVEIRIMQEDKIVGQTTVFFEADAAGSFEEEVVITADALDQSAEYTISAYASALENTIELEAAEDDGLFDDVRDPSHAYFTAIYWAVDKGITKGYSGTNLFGIDDPCTRGQAMMFIWNLAGKPAPKAQSKSPFSDVPTTHPYYKAILWAQQKGITKGYSDGTFGIDKTCTRGHIVTFLWKYKGSPAPKQTTSPFKDKITPAYLKAVLWAVEKGITKGYSDGTFRDSSECTRGMIVKFMHNMETKK